MGKVILVGAEKGGVGKTTQATNLAVYFALEGHSVMLIDADPQGSATSWSQDRRENDKATMKINCIKLSGNIRAEILEIKKHYDYVVVDCAGRDSRELRTGLTAADILYSPLRPSQYDLDTLPQLTEIFRQAKDYNPDLKGFIVINQASTNPFIKEADEAKAYIADYPELKLANCVIHDRKIYRDTTSEGFSIFETDNEKALSEFKAVIQEVMAD
jgi:chromosome partitioning protein